LVNFNLLYREVVRAPYYRWRVDRIARRIHAKWRFSRHRVGTPGEWLGRAGLDLADAYEGFERWRPSLKSAIDRVGAATGEHGGVSFEDGLLLYALVRILKPDYVVETGVAAGISTAFLCAAMAENGCGHLYSIELPPASVKGLQQNDGALFDWPASGVGWAIPEEVGRAMGSRHSLILDDVRVALPRLLEELPALDLFIHDDLHTPEHMLWEYRLAWQKLRHGGVLASDDVNEGWLDFCAENGQPPAALFNLDRFAALRK
jgi:hypothetical protein